MSPAPTVARLSLGDRRAALLAWIGYAGLAAVAAGLSLMLWPQWRRNPDLTHGIFMPLIFVWLVWTGRRSTPRRYLPTGTLLTTGLGLAVTAGLLLFFISALFAASLGWSHAVVGFCLTFSAVLFLSAGLLYYSSQAEQRIPFNWISVCAVALWLLVAPIPPGSYSTLTLRLQSGVTRHVLTTLHLLGVVAWREGNVIRLAHASVGVEEACSGIRSLISCIFCGFFFSAFLLRRTGRRLLVIAAAPVLAVGMNFLRSLLLTLLANAGVNIAGAWHDVTGFAILGLTAVLLAGFALLLESHPAAPAAEAAPSPAAAPPFPAGRTLLLGGLAGALALTLIFSIYARPRSAQNRPPPIAEILPTAVPGWNVHTPDNLYLFTGTLQTDHLMQRMYSRMQDGQLTEIIVYLAYWAPGQAPVSLVASHTPDACWPGTGWEPAPASSARVSPLLDGQPLPAGEYRLFHSGAFPQHVWFWHLYDGRVINHEDPYSPRALLQLAWQYGFRSEGDQLFVRISSNRPWEEFASEPFVRNLVARLRPLGFN